MQQYIYNITGDYESSFKNLISKPFFARCPCAYTLLYEYILPNKDIMNEWIEEYKYTT